MRAEGAFINTSRAFFPTSTVGNKTTTIGAGTIIAGRDRDATGMLVRSRIAADARTQTAYGLLRTYVRMDLYRLQGLYSGGGPAGGANTFANQGGNLAIVHRGFIQFAGFTAGRVQSLFDFYADNYNYEGVASSDVGPIVLAYTYQAGNGISATLSLEDRKSRTNGIGQIMKGGDRGYGVVGTPNYDGSTLPDVVGVLRDDQIWGSAQLSAAYHDVSTDNNIGNTTILTHDTTAGFAVQGGLRVKLPMLAAGDDVWLEGAYQEGAYLYQDSGAYFNGGGTSLALGGFQHIDHDAVAVHTPGAPEATYKLQNGKGFSAVASFNHFFTQQFHDVVFGSYEQITYGNRVKNVDWTLGGLGDASEYRVGNQFLWDPVKNFEIGIELDYMHIDQTLAHDPGVAASGLPTGIAKNPDAFETRLRLERDF